MEYSPLPPIMPISACAKDSLRNFELRELQRGKPKIIQGAAAPGDARELRTIGRTSCFARQSRFRQGCNH